MAMSQLFDFDELGTIADPKTWEGRAFTISSEEAAYMARASWTARIHYGKQAELMREGKAITAYENPTPKQLEEWAQAYDHAGEVMLVLHERMNARLEKRDIPAFPEQIPAWLTGHNKHLVELEPRE